MRVYTGRGLGADATLQFPYYVPSWDKTAAGAIDGGLTRANELSDAETADMIRRVAAANGDGAPSPFGFLDSMSTQSKWLAGAAAGLVVWAVFIRR